MNTDDLKKITQEIVAEASLLSAKHTGESSLPVNYACIFTQSQSEFDEMTRLALQLGTIADDTPTGPVFSIQPLTTSAGSLDMLKVRRPDPKRPERGDADFTATDFTAFKNTHLNKPGFNLIVRKEMEMVELIDSSFNVLAYYSHPTLAEVIAMRRKD